MQWITERWSAVPGIFVIWQHCHVIDLGLTAYAVKRPMGRVAITCGDDLKGIGDMPQQAV